MRSLAEELGYSIVFPTDCRYCGRPIYLFASPNGGFAIFNSLGKPWPKHVCAGVRLDAKRYASSDVVCSKAYELPVPESADVVAVRHSQHISATVVKVEDLGSGTEVTLYDGKRLYEATVAAPIPLGAYVNASLDSSLGHFRIAACEQVDVGDGQDLEDAPVWTQPTDVAELERTDLWQLQIDVHVVTDTEPAVGNLIREALDALINDYTLVGVSLLAELVVTASNTLPVEVKARHIELLFRTLAGTGLDRCVSQVCSQLSRGTRKRIEEGNSDRIRNYIQRGDLRRKLESSRHALRRLEDASRREGDYTNRLLRAHPEWRPVFRRLREMIESE